MGDGAMCHYCRKYKCECGPREFWRNDYQKDPAILLGVNVGDWVEGIGDVDNYYKRDLIRFIATKRPAEYINDHC